MDAKRTGEVQSGLGFVLPSNGSTLPENAVALSPVEVYRLRFTQIKEWNNKSETWPIVYGPALGTLAVFLSSAVTNVAARQMFNLYTQRSFWPTMFPVLLFPCTAYLIATDFFITRRILTRVPTIDNESAECDVCMELRGSVIQMACGSLLPGMLSYLSCSIAAITERSFPVPSLADPKGLWLCAKRFGRQFQRPGSFMLLGHMILGSTLVYTMLKANRAILMQAQFGDNLVTYPPIKK